MPDYICNICEFSTKNKTLYQRHLTCKKHIKLSSNSAPNDENLHIFPHFSTFSHIIENTPEIHKCRYCNKSFARSDSLIRHINENCKDKLNLTNQDRLDRQYEELLNLLEKEREEHKEQLDKVLDKVGNTTINNQTTNLMQTNNVQVNNYGNENLDMLTDNFMKKMVTFPYTAIPKMIKKIHFNDNYPENKNIRMLNKRDGKLQILQKNKWTYVDKKDQMIQLIDDKNYILDRYYEDNKQIFGSNQQTRFDRFQIQYSENNKNIRRENTKDTELVFWNSM